MDDSDRVLTLGFPSLPTPPCFNPTVRPGDTPELAGPSSLFDSSPALPGWYPPTPPDHDQDVLGLSLKLCAFRGFCGVHVFLFFGGVQ